MRCGIPTASGFGRILTPKTRKLSAQADAYLYEIIAERLTGESCDGPSTAFMGRGTDMEPEAVAYYEMMVDVTVDLVGFVTTDDRRIGCSPDGLVGDEGGIEIKILSAANHAALLVNGKAGDDKYNGQVQGQMWVCGLKWVDRIYYNPTMDSLIVRVFRDDEFISQLSTAVTEFADRVDEAYAKLKG